MLGFLRRRETVRAYRTKDEAEERLLRLERAWRRLQKISPTLAEELMKEQGGRKEAPE